MPAFSTHYVFAKELMPFLIENADFEVNEPAVYFGAQGPDVFFFHRVFPWMKGKPRREVGSHMHRSKPEALFNEFRRCCENDGKGIAKSYAYGFLMHYSLDRICHPYVYARQEELVKSGEFTHGFSAHNLVEYSLDSYILNKRCGIEKPYAFDTASTLTPDAAVIEEISKLLADILPKVTGDDIKEDSLSFAFYDMIKIQEILCDESGKYQKLTKGIDRIIKPFTNGFSLNVMLRTRTPEADARFSNTEHKIWVSPYDPTERNESFEELFELAKKDAQKLITEYKSGADCGIMTENKSFLTGVEVK